MSTILYPSPIYGPVVSRRLGISLGVNLMPPDGKVCTFDCLYCECGFNADRRASLPRPTRGEVAAALERQLRQMAADARHPDVITFAGNGEPTAHPEFADIIADTIALRDALCPKARISVLSNATMAARPEVMEALKRVDNNILKLDTVSDAYIARVDRPTLPRYTAAQAISALKAYGGQCIVQTIFMTGESGGLSVDNTGADYVDPWLDALRDIAPREVMIYTIDRETPDHGLRKASPEVLNAIRDRVTALGIACTASY